MAQERSAMPGPIPAVNDAPTTARVELPLSLALSRPCSQTPSGSLTMSGGTGCRTGCGDDTSVAGHGGREGSTWPAAIAPESGKTASTAATANATAVLKRPRATAQCRL
jgi:hypothetical protein